MGPGMDVVAPKSSGRVRARADRASGQPDRPVFRIEDESGRLLRRVRDARHPQEAVALYWRTVGAATPGATMSKDLERRIGRARAQREALRTEELPFETQAAAPGLAATGQAATELAIPGQAASEPVDEDEVAGEAAAQDATPARRARHKPPSATQDDLFEASAPDDPAGLDDAGLDDAGLDDAGLDDADPGPPAPSAAAEGVPAPAPPPDPEPRLLDPQDVLLQRIDPRNLRATDRSDAYLYHVTNGPDAELALRQGLLVSTSDPMILTERQGVGYWLSVLAEDYDYILDGPADFVVLRLRRLAVEELLEPDPHASRSAGCPCYLLTGRG